MKNAVLAILAFLCIFLSACGNTIKYGNQVEYSTNDYSGLNMTVISCTATGATVQIENDTDTDLYGFGNDTVGYEIQAERKNHWYEIKYESVVTNASYPSWMVEKGGIIEWDLSWEYLYGALPKGHYRVVRNADTGVDASATSVRLSAEFDIS